MSAKAELRRLIERHCETIAGEIEAVTGCIERIWEDGTGEALQRSVDATHKIVGSSGSIGFPTVSKAAMALETALKEIERAATPPARPQILNLLHRLRTEAAAMSPDRSTLNGIKI